ncbi:MAG: hypothetical protein U0531_13260 [Dehalococcoidia bacterium]
MFEIIRTWQEVDQEWELLTTVYHWLTPDQLRAALRFYQENREFIEARLAREQDDKITEHWRRFPGSKPPWR